MTIISLLKQYGTRKVPYIFLLILLVMLGCRKDELVKFKTDLALNANFVRVADTAGNTRIQVYSEGKWAVATEEEADWVVFDKNTGNGKGEFIASLKSNEGQLPRAVNVLISSGQKTDTIVLQQKGIVPFIKFADESSIGMGREAEMKTILSTNIPLEAMEITIDYEDHQGWISNPGLEEGYFKFQLAKNEEAVERKAVIHLSFLDAFNEITTASILINQNPKAEFDNAVLKDFTYVKNSVMAGEILEDIYIEGIVVSDKGNPNMGLNPNKETNKHEIDKTENAITVYIQSLDGKSGFHIRTKSAGDNIFGKNEKVQLWLKGITLRKENSPSRSILENVSVMNVISKTQSESVVPRVIHIKDLTDNDLYTLVKLVDVEVTVPFGSFTDINEGYSKRTDCYPTSIRDKNGNSLFLLTNLDVPYRRDGKLIPQGDGDITGIMVHENLPRYGGDIGKYAIRHTTREDIDLRESREDGFSDVLVEWSRFRDEYQAGATVSKNPLTPDLGKGTLVHSAQSSLNFTASGVASNPDYNGLFIQATTVKGLVTNGAWGSKNWWNTTENKGAWWEIKVSTLGIQSPISLQLSGNGDVGGPRNFIVEWSATGNESGVWNQIGEYTMQDVVNWGNTLLTQTPSMKIYDFQFPVAASNQENLVIRLRVKNSQAGSLTSPTGSTIQNNVTSRLGHLSIKYNK